MDKWRLIALQGQESRSIISNFSCIFLTLFVSTVTNYTKKKLEETRTDHFLIALYEKIVEENLTETPGTSIPGAGRPSLKPTPMRLIEKHFPDLIPASDKKKTVTRRCRVCYQKGLRKESRYWCPDGRVGLCIVPCFRDYHTKNNP